MYKYYYIDKAPQNEDLENKLLVSKNFGKPKTITEGDKTFDACGYVLTIDSVSGNAIEDMINNDIFLYNAGVVGRHTKTYELPESLRELIRKEINSFYERAGEKFQISKENFDSFYGGFSLEDYHRMMPSVANRLYLISDKDKSPIEKLFDNNYREQQIEKALTATTE